MCKSSGGHPGRVLGLVALAACILRGQALSTPWVELAPGGAAVVRIVVNNPQDCPAIVVDGRSRNMSLRQPIPDGLRPACEFSLASDAKSASVSGTPLALPRPNPSRIVVFGDTGCRVKGPRVQNCNDPMQWPFAEVAARASAEKADLMIHVGDYLYRESPCPVGSESKCGGAPAGDNWAAWDADFFTPAAKLLASVPWAFSRGNHESCERSWRGWFYYLDPRPWSGKCEKYSKPYRVSLGSYNLVMVDSAAVEEDSLDEAMISTYTRQLASMFGTNGAGTNAASETTWVVAHHPFWGFKTDPSGPPKTLSAPLLEAWKRTSPKNVGLILSGHVHLFELVSFNHDRPPKLVAGDGGTDMAIPLD